MDVLFCCGQGAWTPEGTHFVNYQQPIDNWSPGSVVRRSVNAFQYGWTNLQQYIRTAASRENNAAASVQAEGEVIPLRESVRNSIPVLRNMEPVASRNGMEIPQGGQMVERLVLFSNSFGKRINYHGGGDIPFSRGRIKGRMIGHGVGGATIDIFAAIPVVIRSGPQVDYQKN